MDRCALAAEVDAVCRLTGEFRLRSGERSNEYFDKYLFESDPMLLRRVCEAMVPLIPSDADLLGGLELGGVPLAVVLGQLTGLPTLFVRKEAKAYGTCRLAEGADIAGRAVTLVEDVVTTGGAVRAAASVLRRSGAEVSHVVCAIDRRNGTRGVLDDAQIAVLAVLTKGDLDDARAKPGPSGAIMPDRIGLE
ncbi:orotate phosphoribosyltransferase [Segniliparus rugosus]|uniref:Orotate phosphoribosyltransferase n=1 Tax=Segniliparus rugosus (strain ATCC BAA-974 / DSM 45345 / CCUG 50838 / CIP 108380 / JCM 13579 / CDC 945) TaxID=679197 RepID=E5XT51_SEGRC|nr:orotate phosphoribosyltransferase [Segniliparus rugosus]EFV12462.2 orotate phosphoribosyltransferase [Segniliparus rugosus ATCC BAA-974]